MLHQIKESHELRFVTLFSFCHELTFKRWTGQDSKARHCRRQGKKQSSGLFFSAWLVVSRNVYRDDDRFVVDGTGLEQGVPSAAKAIKAPVGL